MDGTILNKKLKIEEKLAQLNEIAQKVDDMPVFTSNDRAFLEELPGFPAADGKKVLTATTESGETSLAYEEQESGVVDYSTTEQATGQKWIDGKEIYFKAYAFDNTNNATVTIQTTDIDILINSKIISASGNVVQLNYPYYADNGDKLRWYLDTSKALTIIRGDYPIVNGYIVLWYTKTEATVTKRSKKS